MTIECVTDLEDLIEFNIAHLRSSETFQAAQRRGTMNMLLLGMAMGALLAFVGRNWMYFLAGVVGGAVGVVVHRRQWEPATRAAALRIFAGEASKSFIGWHRLTLERDGLLEESEH